MNPKERRIKKMAKKSMLGEGHPTGRAAKSNPVLPTGNNTSWRDEEELVDYDPEDPPSCSPVEDDILVPEDRAPTPEQGSADISSTKDDLSAYPAEEAVLVGRKRRQNLPEGEEQSRKAARDKSADLPRSGGKPVYNDRDKSAALPRSGGKPVYIDRDESAALPRSGGKPVYIDRDESAALPRSGGKPVYIDRDDVLATCSNTTLRGNKSSDVRGYSSKGESKPSAEGRFVAVRGTGSNAPASADEHNPRPSWPCVEDKMVGNDNSPEEKASDARDKVPQQRADPFPLATPRILKSDGQRTDPSSPSELVST
jgi:hypothetical protein